MDISKHPIWTSVSPTHKTKISPFKKPFHLMRISLAKQYSKMIPKEKIIGITGSVGKTITAKVCAIILSQKFKTVVTKPSLDTVLNLPITMLKVKPSTQKVILELGIEYKGEMDYFLEMVHPATAIVTSIGYQHSEFLGGTQEIAAEKGKLVKQLSSNGVAILNYDDPLVRKMADLTEGEVVFYGQDESKCQVWASNVKIVNFQTQFEINYGVERVSVNYPLLGVHQIYPALAGAALGLANGISLMSIKRSLEKVEPEEHRLQALSGYNNSIILDDSYNGSPMSVEAALETLQQISAKRRIVVLGETKELGRYSEELHRKMAQEIYKDRIDYVLLGTGDTKFVADELGRLGFSGDRIEFGLQNPQMVSKLLQLLSKGDVCLVKGSRSLRLDEVVSRIVKKG